MAHIDINVAVRTVAAIVDGIDRCDRVRKDPEVAGAVKEFAHDVRVAAGSAVRLGIATKRAWRRSGGIPSGPATAFA
ncbi:hypothetical protein [Oerskovia enterophila]|uniref:hypothetical protein n=1 Tax=Oerskovia enterophila TaxID=43678 RepID=UPI0037FD40C5